MSGFEWRRVPAGLDASRWVDRGDGHTVLIVIHGVSSQQHLLDVVRLVEPDPRIKVAFTTPPDASDHVVERFLHDAGAVVLPWRQAGRHEFGLAIATEGVAIPHEVRAPLIVMPRSGERRQAINCVGECAAASGAANVHDIGRHPHHAAAAPTVVALSHLAELSHYGAVGRAAVSAVVVGDPSYDRLVVSLPLRDFYRRALGIGFGQRLIVVAATWDTRRQFWYWHDVLSRLLTELPSDEYRVLALSRPDRWATDAYRGSAGPLEHGLSLIPPDADWRAPLVAADWVIGDRVSVAPYGAVTGVPVLLGGFLAERNAPDSRMGELAKMAPRLSVQHSLRAQLRNVASAHRPDRYQPVIDRITSEPGRFNRNMRKLMYRLLGVQQPATIPTTDPVSPPFRIEYP